MLRAKEILDAALDLEPHEREQIAGDLLLSLEEGHDQASIDKAWDDELARRAQELDEGRADLVEWDKVQAKIAKRLGER
jgi:putative addiction module component (TIGR02574 family)